jgi:hypothetical protein
LGPAPTSLKVPTPVWPVFEPVFDTGAVLNTGRQRC